MSADSQAAVIAEAVRDYGVGSSEELIQALAQEVVRARRQLAAERERSKTIAVEAITRARAIVDVGFDRLAAKTKAIISAAEVSDVG